MIISKKRFESEVNRRVRREIQNVQTEEKLLRAEGRIHRLKDKVRELEARIEALEKKGSFKGYFVDNAGGVHETETGTKAD